MVGRYQACPEFFAALKVVSRLQSQGHIAFFAGGCVRDMLLGRPVHDFDVATSARPEIVQGLFRRTLAVGMQFGIVVVRLDGCSVEVATFRSDGNYVDGRRPSSVEFTSPESDAERRDFTINGLFFDPKTLVVHDFIGGQEDLWRGRVRAIGRAEDRIREDHLRLLRAVRFSARFGFAIEEETREAVAAHAELITKVSAERIKDELEKILAHGRRADGLCPLLDLGLLEAIDRPLAIDLEGRREETVARLACLPAKAPVSLAWAVLLASTKHAERVLQRLKSSNERQEQVLAILTAAPSYQSYRSLALAARKRLLRRPLGAMEREYARVLALSLGGDLAELEAAQSELERYGEQGDGSLSARPLITGRELIASGLRPGPGFKELLERAEDWQLEGDCHVESLLSRLRESAPEAFKT